MKILFQREIDQLRSLRPRKNIGSYLMFGLIIVLLMWILGPNSIGYLDIEQINKYGCMTIMLFAAWDMNDSLEQDVAFRQLSFLQTLPVGKAEIVHAKFLSCLALCGVTLIKLGLLVSINLLMNSAWTLESSLIMLFATSLLVFLMAGNLLLYFLRGIRGGNLLLNSMIIVWIVVIFSMGLEYKPLEFSKILLWGLSIFVISLLTYFFCWWVAVRIVHNKGFPYEEVNQDMFDGIDRSREEAKE